jgi:dTDP-4-amino-4,6-dideoxygalactose transaminase
MIFITKTWLPPIADYVSKITAIWEAGIVTNGGVATRELTTQLQSHLSVANLELVTNGTIALQLAIKALNLQGEIITTPFSYVATTTAILWQNCDPVFVDITSNGFCIDAAKIESAITERTSAILATHVYGYPCEVAKIEQIANKYGLKVIYDAAHAFGVKLDGISLLAYGDISAISFHATKLFHTVEGGAVVCKDQEVAQRVNLLKQFGQEGEDNYWLEGINAKMSELHAAMGLCVLPNVTDIITQRRVVFELYDQLLAQSGLIRPRIPANVSYNYAYYPVVFSSHTEMMRVRQALIVNDIMPRRYFYPALNNLPYLRADLRRPCPHAESMASRVLCLPVYPTLALSDVARIAQIVNESMQ